MQTSMKLICSNEPILFITLTYEKLLSDFIFSHFTKIFKYNSGFLVDNIYMKKSFPLTPATSPASL